jgi:hypothetical protein
VRGVERANLIEQRVFELGRDSAGSAIRIGNVVTSDSGIFVLDNAARALFRFGWDGRLALRIPIGITAEAAPPHPRGLAFKDGALYVADLDPTQGLWRYLAAGIHENRWRIDHDVSITDVEIIPEGFVLGSSTDEVRLTRRSDSLLVFVDVNGRTLRRACRADPIYARSSAANGLLSMFTMTGVKSLGGKVFCRQPVSRVVQVFDLEGRLTDSLVFPLPNYRVPEDRAASTSPITINEFKTLFAEFVAHYPTPNELWAVFSRYDTLRAAPQYEILVCGRLETACLYATTPHRPLGLRSDSVLLLKSLQSSGDSFSLALALLSRTQ